MKHPDEQDTSSTILDYYCSNYMEMIQMDMMVDTISYVEWRFYGGYGTAGMNLVRPHHWLLHFREARTSLWVIVESFTECLENHQPPWVMYWDLTSGRLIGIDKNLGVILVRVGGHGYG